jgi:hypothetical protein
MTTPTTTERISPRELVVTRHFDAPPHLVFAAWTNPDLLMRWWAPKSFGITFLSCEVDARTGGSYRFVWMGADMPKRTDIKSIMIIGAGPIVIGQACEFDYSGAQACKALREEGYRVILVNSNPATIMTDPGLADATYIEPITPEVVAKIIEKERPDALLPTMGGQTGLNTALALADMGVLDKFKVELIGAKRDAIEMAEDRKLFREAMDRIGLENPKATIIAAPEAARQV